MEQHPIPQNVTTFQFRLIGDMTLKQFGYLAGGGILAYMAYKLPLPFFFTWPLTALLAFGGIGFAFVPIEERPMDVWFLSFIKSIYSPTQYVWQKSEPTPDHQVTAPQPPASPPVTPQSVKQQITPQEAPHPQIPAMKQVDPPRHQEQTTEQHPPPVSQNEKATTQETQRNQQTQPEHSLHKQSPSPTMSFIPKHLPHFQLPTITLPSLFAHRAAKINALHVTNNQGVHAVIPTQTQSQTIQPTVSHEPVNTAQNKPVPSAPQARQATSPVVHHQSTRFSLSLSSLFGFTRKKPAARGVTIHQDMATQQARAIHTSAPPANQTPASVFPAPQSTVVTGEHLNIDTNEPQPDKSITNQLTKQNEAVATQAVAQDAQKLQSLETQLQSMKHELDQKSLSESRILELQKQLTDVLSAKQNLEKQVAELTKKASQQPITPPQPLRQAGVVNAQQPMQPTVRVITPDAAVRSGLPRLTTFPNVVTGIIKDYAGNLLPGVLVTVRDKDDIPVRALKSNKLGQFAASTPLTNSTYTVDIEDPKRIYTFDRVQITLNGNILPPLEIIAKSKRDIERDQLARQVFSSPNT